MKSIQYYINKGKLFALPLMMAMFAASCTEDTNTGASELTPTNPTVTVAGETTVSMTEANQDFTYTVTLSETQIVDIVVYITQTGGTATEGEDFALSTPKVVIPAYSTSASFVVSVLGDLDESEETETFTLQVGDSRTANASITPVTLNYELLNVSGDPLSVIDITASWDIEPYYVIDQSGNVSEFNKCALADIDVVLFDADFNVVDGYAAATGACPEHTALDFGALGDGQYILLAFYWSGADPSSVSIDPISYPLQLTFERYNTVGNMVGSISHTQGADEIIITSETPAEWAHDLIPVAGFDVSDGNVDIYSQDDVMLGTLRFPELDIDKIKESMEAIRSRK